MTLPSEALKPGELSEGAKLYKKYIEDRVVYCVICGQPGETHHLFARGMGSKGRDGKGGGCDCEQNRLPLCCYHHHEAHHIGTKAFCIKYALDRVYERSVEHSQQRGRGETACRKVKR